MLCQKFERELDWNQSIHRQNLVGYVLGISRYSRWMNGKYTHIQQSPLAPYKKSEILPFLFVVFWNINWLAFGNCGLLHMWL